VVRDSEGARGVVSGSRGDTGLVGTTSAEAGRRRTGAYPTCTGRAARRGCGGCVRLTLTIAGPRLTRPPGLPHQPHHPDPWNPATRDRAILTPWCSNPPGATGSVFRRHRQNGPTVTPPRQNQTHTVNLKPSQRPEASR
jgi:hypothetical protein